MLKLVKYLKKSVGYIILIVMLLFLQAYCDLSLPTYTSEIVNVGIQQKGIVDGVPEMISDETLSRLELFMNADDAKTVENAYEGGQGEEHTLKDMSSEERAHLNSILGKPEVILANLTADAEAQAAIKKQMGLSDDEDLFEALGQMPAAAKEEMLAEMSKQTDQMPDSIITQTAVTFVESEYTALGEDLDQRQMNYLFHTGLLMLGLALLGMIAAILVTFLASKIAASLGHDLRNAVYRKVIGFSSGEYNQFSTASLITRSTNDVQQVQLAMVMIFRIAIYAPILGIGGVIKVFQTDISMTWVIALGLALIFLVILVLFKIAMPRFKKVQVLIDKLNLVTREILTGLSVIRAFSREEYEEEHFDKANVNLMKTQRFVNRCMTFMMPLMMLIMNGITVLIVYNGAFAVDSGTMQVGDMMAFIQYAMQIIMSFLMLTMLSIMLPRASVSGTRISEILDTKASILDPENPKQPDPSIKGRIEFDNVSFAYPDAEENVLTDISFIADKGETVAIIGSTGSGKSSLVNLIPRFYDVTKGAVRLDGVDIREMTQHDVRARLGYVPQKGVLFSGTIESNIRYGRPDASQEEVEKAAQIAQAEEFIMEKPEKFDAPISQGGTNVSGGQKQRLSIARAIEKNPEILIFDDSFSALDFKTDVTLRKALKEATADTTTIIVAQRISTIMNADRILVLDDGELAGIGTHKELLQNCEVYQQIAQSQLSEEELAG